MADAKLLCEMVDALPEIVIFKMIFSLFLGTDSNFLTGYPDIECPADASSCSLSIPKTNGLPCYDDALLMPKPQKEPSNSRTEENHCRNQNAEEYLPTYETATSR